MTDEGVQLAVLHTQQLAAHLGYCSRFENCNAKPQQLATYMLTTPDNSSLVHLAILFFVMECGAWQHRVTHSQ
jgi:hypothetical protein